MSVDTRTAGRRLDGYQPTRIGDVEILVDADLARLPVEVTVKKAGVFGRGVGVHVAGVDGAPCPIDLVR